MIFAFSPGSEGSGTERYVASLPFVVAPGTTIGPFDAPVASSWKSLNLRVKKLHHIYALTCGPFTTEAEAIGQPEKFP